MASNTIHEYLNYSVNFYHPYFMAQNINISYYVVAFANLPEFTWVIYG